MMTDNQTAPVTDEELDQMIWKLERDGMTPKQLSLMRELREVRRAKGEPVAWTEKCEITNMQATGLYLRGFPDNSQGREIPLYTVPPAPVVPDALADSIDSDDHPLLWSYNNGWNACRAAMLQGAEPVTTAYKSPDDFICMLTGRAKYLREKGEIKSPELLERAAAALQRESVNITHIPNGWKLVPIDPTKDMLRAGQSVVGFWLNTVHCYSKMLAAAPAAPKEVG